MIFGIKSPETLDGDEVYGSMNDDRDENGIALDIAPGQPQTGRQILQEGQKQRKGLVGIGIAQQMDGGENQGGQNIAQSLIAVVHATENDTAVQNFLNEGHKENGTDGHGDKVQLQQRNAT